MATQRVPAAALTITRGLPVITWPALDEAGVDAIVTTRSGGVSTGPYESLNLALHVADDRHAVIQNRRLAANALGAGLDDLVFGQQVHGTLAAAVTARDAGRGARHAEDALTGTDALVTSTPRLVLVTLVADCVPIALVDPEAKVLAVVHAGWRGTASGVAGAALRTMASLGAAPGRVVAGIGPAVSPRTYTVGNEVAEAVGDQLGDAAATVLTPLQTDDGHWLLDLPRANELQLCAAGVPAPAIHVAPFTTGDGQFYSDRAQRPCGRFGLLARLR